jgi:hypothetical protein
MQSPSRTRNASGTKSRLFKVEIIAPGANRFYEDGYQYVSLSPHTEYKLKLVNDHTTRCDAKVYIDNTLVGIWRIDSNSSIIVERPQNTQRRFTFVGENSRIARQTGAISGSEDNGSVRVVFRPAKHGKYYEIPVYAIEERSTRTATRNGGREFRLEAGMSEFRSKSPPRTSTIRSLSPSRDSLSSSRRYDAGVTVLGRDSHQKFEHTTALDNSDIDWNLVTEINIRLVIRNQYKDYIPLSNAKDGVPPRLDRRYY